MTRTLDEKKKLLIFFDKVEVRFSFCFIISSFQFSFHIFSNIVFITVCISNKSRLVEQQSLKVKE